ncbi:Uu.00g035660.m01.CDS01 [Anthostomella pinea]|uniref:Uu.00g035660.m01.CDS01 n=1 Tax=Anthostomella pinea TaxID=933095 RepID=A0AAI8V9D6_9PEZI|nr:Uu.00g035660.m01.CDS01 [Anthostomella pinea]
MAVLQNARGGWGLQDQHQRVIRRLGYAYDETSSVNDSSLSTIYVEYIVPSAPTLQLQNVVNFIIPHCTGQRRHSNSIRPWGELWGGSLPPRFNEPTHDLIEKANQNPTLTQSVSFKPLEQYWQFLGDGSVIKDAEWTWRINVTNIDAPDADTNGSITGSHVVETYDFTWLVSGNISTALDGTTNRLCVKTLGDWVDLPANVTNAYGDNDRDSTDCGPVLGQDCVNAILAQGSRPSATDCNFNLASSSWAQIPECRDSFGVTSKAFHGFSEQYYGFSLFKNNSKILTSGRGFLWNITEPVDGTNSRSFHNLANKLHILLLDMSFSFVAPGKYPGPQLLCTCVNTTKLSEVDIDGDGVAFTSETVLESRSLGASIHRMAYHWPWVMIFSFSATFLAFL